MRYCLLLFILSCAWTVKGQSSCSDAVTATLGTNHLPDTDAEYYWYRFAMPSDGVLEVSSGANEFVYVYTNSCVSLDLKKEGYGNVSTTLRGGDEVFIKWESDDSKGDFDWSLMFTPLEEGRYCGSSVQAIEGTNTVPTVIDEYWYHFTMPIDGKLQVTSSSSERVNAYVNNCKTPVYSFGTYENITVLWLNKGDEIFIKWDIYNGNGNFDWNLAARPFEAGDDCEHTKPAVLGKNTVPVTENDYYIYSYAMPEDGRLHITSSTRRHVRVLNKSCYALKEVRDQNGNITITSLNEGDSAFIVWHSDGDGDFDWNLSVLPFQEGDACSFSKNATLGTNTLPATENDDYYWYSYTMPVAGKLQITSSFGKQAEIFSGDCSNLIKEERKENTTDRNFAVGEMIFVRWNTAYSDGEFDWNLSISEPDIGADCSTAAVANMGANVISIDSDGYYWYYHVASEEGKLRINSMSSEQVYIYDGICGELNQKGNGYGNVSIDVFAGQKILIKWHVKDVSDLNWNMLFVPYEAGDICSLATAAADGINFTPHLPYWFEYHVPVTGDYVISSVGTITNNTCLQVYSDCSGTLIEQSRDFSGTQSELTLSLNNDDTVYILWDSVDSSEGFEWRLLSKVFKATDTIDCSYLTATTFKTNDVTCSKVANGSITVSASGGEAPYSYSLDGTIFQEDSSFTSLDSGQYTITVKDANGCATTTEASISTVGALRIDGIVTASTQSVGNGSIALTVSGGNAPYSYAWGNGATTAHISNLTLGTYEVIVTDASGCTANTSFIVEGVTGIDEQLQAGVTVYPNPGHEVLYIKVPAESSVKVATLYGIMGNKVSDIQLARGINRLNISGLQSGSYLLRIDQGDSHRITIQ